MMPDSTQNEPSLTKSYRGAYPFKIGTTSFIYRDQYAPNVRRLAPYLDEIELLFFESPQETDPILDREIKTLSELARESDISYNVHLPTDVDLGDDNPARRQLAVDAILRVIDLTASLSPSTHTLHLACSLPSADPEGVSRWQKNTRESLTRLIRHGVSPHKLAIENLFYPFSWIENIIRDFDLRICMDIGHLLVSGMDTTPFFHRYSSIVPIIHLHGVHDGQDHLSLDRFPADLFDPILDVIREFRGTVSIEVFSFDGLQASLQFLDNAWH